MLDELYYNLKYFEEELFEESSKSRDVFRTQANSFFAFFVNILNSFRNKSVIVDV